MSRRRDLKQGIATTVSDLLNRVQHSTQSFFTQEGFDQFVKKAQTLLVNLTIESYKEAQTHSDKKIMKDDVDEAYQSLTRGRSRRKKHKIIGALGGLFFGSSLGGGVSAFATGAAFTTAGIWLCVGLAFVGSLCLIISWQH